MWTITRLPSQVRVTPVMDRAHQIREERLANEIRRLRLIRKANGIPSPETWMW